MHLKQPSKNNLEKSSAFRYLALCAVSITAILGSCDRPQKLDAQENRSSLQQSAPQRIANADVNALVEMGPRVTGNSAIIKARTYLLEEFRKAGYVAELQPFTYTKFVDQGSTLTVDGTPLQGRGLEGSPVRQVNARLVVVPGVGKSTDFSKVDIKGAIAIVQRGEIRFGQKAENAEKAGAIGLIIINNKPGPFGGTLARETTIPVLALSGEEGLLLVSRVSQQSKLGSLNVNARRQEVTGQNVVAYSAGVTQPKLIIGGHYDSVEGSPGANDNASGTAVTLAIARQLRGSSLARQAWFVAFDGEEDGLHGSQAFVKAAQPTMLQRLQGMLNFDMVGLNEQLQVSGTQALTDQIRSLDSKIVVSENRNDSDHASFADANIPVLFFHRGLDPNYHQPGDRLVNAKLLDETTEIALKLIRNLLN